MRKSYTEATAGVAAQDITEAKSFEAIEDTEAIEVIESIEALTSQEIREVLEGKKALEAMAPKVIRKQRKHKLTQLNK